MECYPPSPGELSGELLEEVHQIWHWNELETYLYFVLVTIKGIF